MTATIAPVIPFPPQPSRSSVAIAEGILAAGRGPEVIPSLVAGFRHAAELEREIRTALAAMSPLEARLSSTVFGAVLAASGPGAVR